MSKPCGPEPVRQVRFDAQFLEALEKDPVCVLREYGIEPTPEMIDAIREIDFAPLYKLAAAFPVARSAEPTLEAREVIDEAALVFP